MSAKNLLHGLDEEQKKAVTMETNGIAAAGAGSGKTRVLASRYAWLVTEKNLDPEEILTLTFTNKAVSEMYSRIYRYLLEQASCGNEKAAKALTNFHKARISTLDAFSAGIARSAAARYGINPDFTSDDAGLRELAGEAALRFVLDHREDPAIREFMVDNKIRKIAKEIFASFVIRHSPISSPLDLDKNLSMQKEMIGKLWREKVGQLEKLTGCIIDALHTLAGVNKSIGFTVSLGEILLKSPLPTVPDISSLLDNAGVPGAEGDDNLTSSKIRQQLKEYFDYYSTLASVRLPGRFGEAYTPVVEYFRALKSKDGLYQELESLANYACGFGICAGIFRLLKEFQNEFNIKKREAGLLSFNDIACLALDALKDHPDIRKVYKDVYRMIMIDEFQDNNALQRDLVYLLAENPGRTDKGIPSPGELEQNRMFFVGDEKQSIYLFRGADVAVFRSLGRNRDSSSDPSWENIELNHNYRSRPGLIAAFNHIFSRVFLTPGPDVPDYEAAYSGIKPPESSAVDKQPLAHFCFLNSDELPGSGSEGIKSHDLEAAFIAEKIRDMVRNGEKIPRRTDEGIKWESCSWSDFAVLERYYTHQSSLEKYFREFGIPYTTDRPSGLFNDAPILDLRAFLRLIVYPEDRIAYAALIRSPFMRLSDKSLAVCMLSVNTAGLSKPGVNTPGKSPELFAEENESLIPEEDLELYRRARERYRSACEASRALPITELITKLWYEEGYRYETLWTEQAQVYENLFDLFFSLACDAEARGKSLADFIEYLDDVMDRKEKPDDRDIPGEGEAGVRIMSIHKSKGLEFPVVFIFDCTNSDNSGNNPGLLCYHAQYGVILNLPHAEELPLGGNFFRKITGEEEDSKEAAELRRLLYVAMTRAEYKLFLTFTLPSQTKEEKKEWDMETAVFDEDTIRRRLLQLEEKDLSSKTFLTLLGPVLPECPASLCTLEAIPALFRAEISKRAGAEKKKNSQRESALEAAPFYKNAQIIESTESGPMSLNASKMRYAKASGEFRDSDETEEDRLFEKAGLGPADFGSLVHAVLEAQLTGQPCNVPPRIRSRLDEENAFNKLMASAEIMAGGFLASDLGKRWAAAGRRETEFPIITSAAVEGKTIAIMGQIDLLFEEEDKVVVVDFKTDRNENPEDHYGQLAAYCRAAGDIFGKSASVWLFYLRSGRAVDVTEAIKSLPLEEIAEAALDLTS